MRRPRIYSNQRLAIGDTAALAPQAASHVARVLRLGIDAQLTLFNGDGHEYGCTIVSATKKEVSVRVTEATLINRESPLETHLGLVMSKSDRFEYALQKATELGVSSITPLTSSRCEVQLSGDRRDKKLDQWRAICIGACEQSQRNLVPELRPIDSIQSWLALPQQGLKLVLHHRAAQPLTHFDKPEALTLLVGPEGGLSDAEIDQALAKGFQACLLGPRVLRTETAPLVALAVAQSLWGDY